MPYRPPTFGEDPTPRQLQRVADGYALSHVRAAGTVVRNIGRHIMVEQERPRRLVSRRASIPVRLSAYDATNKIYSGVLQTTNGGGGYTDASPTVTNTRIVETRNFIGVELGAIVFVRPAGGWTGSAGVMAVGTPLFGFSFVLPRQMFAVKVTKTGGATGPPSTWTYTVTSPDGHAIATSAAPELGRPASVATTAPPDGSIGTGYYDAAGAFHLFDSNERC